MKNEIKANLLKLEQLEEIANHAEADYEREPENSEYEKIFDMAYDNQFSMFITVSNQISDFSGIDARIAREIVRTKREELKKILA